MFGVCAESRILTSDASIFMRASCACCARMVAACACSDTPHMHGLHDACKKSLRKIVDTGKKRD
jgi:hypothetical protein